MKRAVRDGAGGGDGDAHSHSDGGGDAHGGGDGDGGGHGDAFGALSRHPRSSHPRHPRSSHPRHPRSSHPRHPRSLLSGGGDGGDGGDGDGGGGGDGDAHGDAGAPPARPADILLRGPGHFLALGFGAGLAPIAPGTAGSLVALPFVFLFAQLGAWASAVAVIAGLAIGVIICARAARALGKNDHPAIVWDEVVGMWAALCFIPLSPAAILAGFLLFRAFDIAKPWPIRRLERLPGGLGVMLDDLAAGVLANLALRILLPYLP